MAAEIINLRKARKDRARALADDKAAENRIRFGRSKAERDKLKAEQDLAARRIDGHRLDEPDPDTGR